MPSHRMRLTTRRVLVRKDPVTTQIGSIHLPETAKRRAQLGVVVAISPDVTTVKVNDRVLYGRYAGSDLDLPDDTLVLLWERDIIAVLEPEDALGTLQ